MSVSIYTFVIDWVINKYQIDTLLKIPIRNHANVGIKVETCCIGHKNFQVTVNHGW